MNVGETFDPAGRTEWRQWLAENHASKQEIWLVSWRAGSARRSMPYSDAVEEALCFGWIDSTNKLLDESRRAQRYTPRRSGSPWSETNKARARKLVAQGLMTDAGLAAGIDFLDETYEPPADIIEAIRQDAEAWAHFEGLPEAYVRIRVGWIDGARSRPEVFEQRLAYFVKKTRQGKRFGIVQD